MNDFLSHLASRAVSPVPVVRPLVRTPFEPSAAGEFSFPTVTDPVPRESPPLPDAPLPIQRTGTRDTPRPPVPDLPPPLAHRKTPSAVAAQPAKIEASVESLSKILPASPASTPAPEVPFQQPLARTQVSPVTRPISETEVIVPAAAVQAETMAVRQANGRDSDPPGNPFAVAKIPELRSPATSPNPPVRPRLETMPRIPPRSVPAQSKAPATPQPAPQVTITIGRVEIRAAAPVVQPSPPPAASGPPVSLETYLRRSATRSA